MAFMYEPGRGKQSVACSKALFETILNDEKIRKTIQYYRNLKARQKELEARGEVQQAAAVKGKAAAVKSQMPGWLFSTRDIEPWEWIDSKGKNHGVGKWRNGEWAYINGLIMCDFDHLEDPLEVYRQHIEPLITKWNIRFVFITPGGEGLKVVFRGVPEIGDIQANQKAFADNAGVVLDEVCLDPARLSFVCSKADVLWLDEQLFTEEVPEFIGKYEKGYRKGVKSQDLFGGNEATVGQSDDQPDAPAADSDYSNYTYCGIAIPDVIDKLLKGKSVPEGIRHDTLFHLCKKLRYVCERSEACVAYFVKQLDWVKEHDAKDHNVDRAIADAMAKPYSSYKPKDLMNALAELGYVEEEEKTGNEQFAPYTEFGERIEALFDKFPCLREACFGLETSSYPAALFVSAAFFGTLMTRTWYHFWFAPSEVRRLNYGVFIIGDPGSGKSFAGSLYKIICEPIAVVDKVGNDAINNFKKERNQRKDSLKEQKKDALQQPENIIRIHGTRTANGVFIEDMVGAVDTVEGKPMNLHLLTFSAELDQITMANKGGQWIDKSGFELLAFHNEEDNQQYKNVESVSGPFNVYWNFVYTGTPLALYKKVNERNFGSGLYSRLGCVPMASDYFSCAEEGKVTKEDLQRQETLRQWAYVLDKVQGELPIGKLVHETHVFVQDVIEMAKIEEDKVDAYLIKRVPYYGINVAVPFVFMRHYEEWKKNKTFVCDKYDVELCQLIMEIQLHSQRLFFGKLAEKYIKSSDLQSADTATTQRKKKSDAIFEALKEEFSRKDLMELNVSSPNAAKVLVYKWKKAGRIKVVSSKKSQEVWKKV